MRIGKMNKWVVVVLWVVDIMWNASLLNLRKNLSVKYTLYCHCHYNTWWWCIIYIALFLFLWSSSAYKSVQLLLFISLSSMKHVCIRFNGQMTNLRLYLSFCDLWLNKPRIIIQCVGLDIYVSTLYSF